MALILSSIDVTRDKAYGEKYNEAYKKRGRYYEENSPDYIILYFVKPSGGIFDVMWTEYALISRTAKSRFQS